MIRIWLIYSYLQWGTSVYFSQNVHTHTHTQVPLGSAPHKSTSDLTPQLLLLPSVYLGDIMQSLLIGRLTARIICVQCRLTSVQWVSLQYKCQGCGCTIIDGVCLSACPHHRPTLKAEARYNHSHTCVRMNDVFTD